MPFLAAPIAALGGITWGTVISGSLTLLGLNASRRQARKARDAYNASLKDRKLTVRASDAPSNYVYGQTVVGGKLAYSMTTGPQKETLHVVLMLARHEINAISDIYFDGESIGPLDVNGYVQSGSKYHIDRQTARTEEHTGPAAGGTITLAGSPEQILAVWLDPDDHAYYHLAGGMSEGSQWVAVTGGVQFVGSVQTGHRVFVTYRDQTGGAMVRVQKFLGLPAGERNTDLEAATASTDDPWTATDLLRGIPSLHITLDYDDELFSGLPNISALVEGKKLYDPRTGETKYDNGVGRNAALVIRDFLTSDSTILGFGCSASEIDDANIIAAANICDEFVEVTSGGFQVRYLCDGVIDADASPRQNLEALLTSCVGSAVWSQGQWRIYPAAQYAIHADNHYTDDDLATGEIETQQGAPYSEIYNSVRGQFIDPSNKYALNDFPPYRSQAYITQDNNETIFKDFDFPFCTDAIRAQRLAKLALHKMRQSIVDSAWYKMKAIRAQPGDVIGITRPWDGWVDKSFTLIHRQFDPAKMAVQMTVREDAAAIYDDGYGEWRTPDAAPNTTFPNPNFVSPLQNVTATSGASTFSISTDNTFLPYVQLDWAAVTSSDVLRGGYIQVRWKRANELAFKREKLLPTETQARLSPVFSGDQLIIEIRAYNGIVVSSEPVFVTHTVSSSIPTAGQVADRSNLLPQSTFLSSIDGWLVAGDINAAIQAPLPLSSFAVAAGSNDIVGEPGNAIFNVNSGLQKTGQAETVWLLSPQIQVEHLQNYLMQCRVLNSFAHVKVWLVLYQSSGQMLQKLGTNVRLSNKTATNLANRTQYEQVACVDQVTSALTPYARLAFECSVGNDIAGYPGAARVSIWQPMVSKTLQKTDTRPVVPAVWSPGPETLVTGGNLAGGMLGEVVQGFSSQTLPYTLAPSVNWATIAELVFDNPNRARFAILRVTTTIKITQGTTPKAVVYLFLSANNWLGQAREYKIVEVADIFGLAQGSFRTVTSTVTHRIDMEGHPPGNTAAAFAQVQHSDADEVIISAVNFELQYEQ